MAHPLGPALDRILGRRPAHASADSPPVSLWRASARAVPPQARHRLRQRAKFLVRSLLEPRLTRAWLSRLAQPDIAPLWVLHPRLATKLQRPYVSREWSAWVRFAALVGHYHAMPRLFSAPALTALYADGLEVLRLVTPTGRAIALRLAYHDQFEKEGELTLSMVDCATGLSLAGITFCLAQQAERAVLVIGGLQAHPDPRTRALIHDVAKEMCGLRAKAFALWGVQQLAAAWNVARIEAVCDAQHIYRHWRKRRNIRASYDEFWEESDGTRLPGGGWELPLQARERSRAELKPARRKQHEQRYALLHQLRPALFARLAGLAMSATAATAPAPEISLVPRALDSLPPSAAA